MRSLEDKIFWTKKARIQTENRLLANDKFAQFIIFWYSLFSVGVSVYQLKFGSTNPNYDVMMVCFTILILCASLFIGNQNFQGRAMLIKQCHEQLSTLQTKATLEESDLKYTEIFNQYEQILGVCENHSSMDFKCALVGEYFNTKEKDRLSRLPTRWNIVEFFVWYFFRFVIAVSIVGLPIIILILGIIKVQVICSIIG